MERGLFQSKLNWYESFEGGSLFYYYENSVSDDYITINSLSANFIQSGFLIVPPVFNTVFSYIDFVGA